MEIALSTRRLSTACESISACEIVCRKPPNAIQDLIQDLRSSTALQDRRSLLSPSETMYTDRRYRNRESSNRDQSRYPSKPRYDSNNSNRDPKAKKRCFVCKKEGCWSTNHPKEERQRSIKQYITDIEGGKEENNDDDTTDDTSDDNEADKREDDESFLTSMGPIDGKTAYRKLTNQATLHAVTGSKFTQDPYINIPGELPLPALYQSAPRRLANRYGDDHFRGLMIDTGAAHNSSAGFNQYLALRREQNVNINTDKAGTAKFQVWYWRRLIKGHRRRPITNRHYRIPYC